MSWAETKSAGRKDNYSAQRGRSNNRGPATGRWALYRATWVSDEAGPHGPAQEAAQAQADMAGGGAGWRGPALDAGWQVGRPWAPADGALGLGDLADAGPVGAGESSMGRRRTRSLARVNEAAAACPWLRSRGSQQEPGDSQRQVRERRRCSTRLHHRWRSKDPEEADVVRRRSRPQTWAVGAPWRKQWRAPARLWLEARGGEESSRRERITLGREVGT